MMTIETADSEKAARSARHSSGSNQIFAAPMRSLDAQASRERRYRTERETILDRLPLPRRLFRPKESCLLVYLAVAGQVPADEKHRVFGVGGCAILRQNCHRVVDEPWHQLKRKFKIENSPLDASNVLIDGSTKLRTDLLRYFSDGRFSRFAVFIRADPQMPLFQTISHKVVGDGIHRTIARIAVPYPLASIALIFEDNELANRLAHLSLTIFESQGRQFQMAHERRTYQMDLDPGLEVANFIANIAASRIRRGQPDDLFQATFTSVSPELTAYTVTDATWKPED
jgi:hypothetical protein